MTTPIRSVFRVSMRMSFLVSIYRSTARTTSSSAALLNSYVSQVANCSCYSYFHEGFVLIEHPAPRVYLQEHRALDLQFCSLTQCTFIQQRIIPPSRIFLKDLFSGLERMSLLVSIYRSTARSTSSSAASAATTRSFGWRLSSTRAGTRCETNVIYVCI